MNDFLFYIANVLRVIVAIELQATKLSRGSTFAAVISVSFLVLVHTSEPLFIEPFWA